MIDDTFKFKIDEKIVCNKATKGFSKLFDLSQMNLQFGKHRIKIWAEDTYGLQSNDVPSEFYYVRYAAPSIEVVSPKDKPKRYFDGEIEISLKVTNIIIGERITVLVKLPEDPEVEPMQTIYSFVADGDHHLLSYTYKVKTVIPQEYTVKFVAADSQQVQSTICPFVFEKINYPTPTATPYVPTATPHVPTPYPTESIPVGPEPVVPKPTQTPYVPTPEPSASPKASESNLINISSQSQDSNGEITFIIIW